LDSRTATEIAVGPEAAHVVIDAQGKFANAMCNNPVVGLRQKKVITTIPTGKRPSPDGRELYVVQVGAASMPDGFATAVLSQAPP